MVVSNRHKFIYSVIPKCASASIRHALRNYVDRGWPVDNSIDQHITLAHVFQDDELKLFYDQGYLSFTFVRNPYDRLFSSFKQDYYASQHYPKWIKAKASIFNKIGYDFKAYVLDYVAKASIREAWDWIAFCPMADFFEYEDKSLDFVGRYEDLEIDINRLSGILGIPILIEESINVRDQKEETYMNHYDQELIAFVNSTYRYDFELFDYAQVTKL